MRNIDELKRKVFAAVSALLDDSPVTISENTPLIGDDHALNSMKFLELCLSIEDIAMDFGFEFDWTSETAMSKSRIVFRTAGTLSDEFLSQMAEKR